MSCLNWPHNLSKYARYPIPRPLGWQVDGSRHLQSASFISPWRGVTDVYCCRNVWRYQQKCGTDKVEYGCYPHSVMRPIWKQPTRYSYRYAHETALQLFWHPSLADMYKKAVVFWSPPNWEMSCRIRRTCHLSFQINPSLPRYWLRHLLQPPTSDQGSMVLTSKRSGSPQFKIPMLLRSFDLYQPLSIMVSALVASSLVSVLSFMIRCWYYCVSSNATSHPMKQKA